MSIKIQVHRNYDFKLRACLDYSHLPWNLHRNPKTAELKPIADFFRGRCARLRSLMQLPAQIGSATIKLRDNYMRSMFDVTGGLDPNRIAPEDRDKIERRSNELFAQMAEDDLRLQDTPDWDAHVHQNLVGGLIPVETMAGEPHAIGMLQASMMSYLTTGWTIMKQ
jgi:hypothetical protein